MELRVSSSPGAAPAPRITLQLLQGLGVSSKLHTGRGNRGSRARGVVMHCRARGQKIQEEKGKKSSKESILQNAPQPHSPQLQV